MPKAGKLMGRSPLEIMRADCRAARRQSNNVANAKNFHLEWTIPDLARVMTTAKLAAMIYNPVYLRDVYERP
jgi:hypothetical protein